MNRDRGMCGNRQPGAVHVSGVGAVSSGKETWDEPGAGRRRRRPHVSDSFEWSCPSGQG